TLEHAPEQVEQEHELDADGEESGVRHEFLKRNQVVEICEFRQLGVTAGVSRQAQIMHGHKDRIGSNECDPEMDATHTLAHHSSEHLREPVVGSGENPEDRSHTHDEMEVSNDEIRVVQRNVEDRLSQERSAQTARHE